MQQTFTPKLATCLVFIGICALSPRAQAGDTALDATQKIQLPRPRCEAVSDPATPPDPKTQKAMTLGNQLVALFHHGFSLENADPTLRALFANALAPLMVGGELLQHPETRIELVKNELHIKLVDGEFQYSLGSHDVTAPITATITSKWSFAKDAKLIDVIIDPNGSQPEADEPPQILMLFESTDLTFQIQPEEMPPQTPYKLKFHRPIHESRFSSAAARADRNALSISEDAASILESHGASNEALGDFVHWLSDVTDPEGDSFLARAPLAFGFQGRPFTIQLTEINGEFPAELPGHDSSRARLGSLRRYLLSDTRSGQQLSISGALAESLKQRVDRIVPDYGRDHELSTILDFFGFAKANTAPKSGDYLQTNQGNVDFKIEGSTIALRYADGTEQNVDIEKEGVTALFGTVPESMLSAMQLPPDLSLDEAKTLSLTELFRRAMGFEGNPVVGISLGRDKAYPTEYLVIWLLNAQMGLKLIFNPETRRFVTQGDLKIWFDEKRSVLLDDGTTFSFSYEPSMDGYVPTISGGWVNDMFSFEEAAGSETFKAFEGVDAKRKEALRLLEFPEDARPTVDEVRKRFHRLAVRTHPDLFPAGEKAEREAAFKDLNNAASLLGLGKT